MAVAIKFGTASTYNMTWRTASRVGYEIFVTRVNHPSIYPILRIYRTLVLNTVTLVIQPDLRPDIKNNFKFPKLKSADLLDHYNLKPSLLHKVL